MKLKRKDFENEVEYLRALSVQIEDYISSLEATNYYTVMERPQLENYVHFFLVKGVKDADILDFKRLLYGIAIDNLGYELA